MVTPLPPHNRACSDRLISWELPLMDPREGLMAYLTQELLALVGLG